MRLDLARRVRRNPISLTPLIDVVFILLLFFMLASHFDQWRALALDARGAKVGATAPSAARAAMLVRLHADARLDLGGEPLTPPQLERRVVEALDRDPELIVVIQSDPEVELQTIVSTIDRLVAAGAPEVRLQ
ncbi:biopolymer transporter ExbD [Marichromatium sp. AB32]|uniref:ExbD/TolR family protein n=1 Tax=Marichromatium sp. AB32 TaxID=2483363 RepID=UPI000F3C4AE1|nr:biopolymer transporter ExbD [Marichromatium sp. AB32]RNE90915.1 biopolymer transporter ExbD [Marichromatium sp. AB32]